MKINTTMETYIIIFVGNIYYKNTFVTDTIITDEERKGVSDGVLDIIRLSDMKQLTPDGEWVDLLKWTIRE